MIWVVTIILIIAFLAATAGGAVLFGRHQERRARTMAVIARDKSGSSREELRDKHLAKQRADIAKKLKEAGQETDKKKDKTSIRDLLDRAGLDVPVTRYWVGSFISGIVAWGTLSSLTSWPQIAVVFATLAAFMGLPRMVLKFMAGRRQKKFLADFADALDAAVRLLQSGMPISEAIAMVSREFKGPIREEMSRVYDNQKIGVPLGQACLEMAKRVPLTEVHMFATAIKIQSETGSSLSEILSNLAAVIRARFRLKRKVKALSQEAKSSAAIIASLPILVSLGLYGVNEEYISILFITAKGKFVLGCAIGWMGLGIFVMWQMIDFRV